MMAFSIMYWMNFVSGTKKLHKKSEIAVKSDHVLKFTYDPEQCHVQGRVQASMRDRSYHVNITLGDNYVVDSSVCDCVNGQDKCHHKASLLLYGYKNLSKTDVRASWIQHPKSAPPKKTLPMDELFPPPPKLSNYRATSRPVEDSDIAFLRERLNGLGRFSAMHWIISEEPPTPELSIPSVEDLLLDETYIRSLDKLQWLRSHLAVSSGQIEEVAKLTTGQRDNHLWSLVRKHRLTASNFGLVLAAIKRKRFPPSLYKQLFASYNLSTKDAIMWGISNESSARDKYCSFGDAVVEETGVWLHESGVLGASPDGLIRRCATHNYQHQVAQLTDVIEGLGIKPALLEIKCPFAARNMTIPEAIGSIKDFCIEYQAHEGRKLYKLKEGHRYYDQMQGQLHITNKSACDFVVWTTKDIAIVRVLQDNSWTPNMSLLLDFYFSKVVPLIQQ